jgi:hypothetical protein
MTVTNGLNCTAKTVYFCSYRIYIANPNPGWLATQTLFDSSTATLQPGESRTMSVNTDNCQGQVDGFEGGCPTFTSDSGPTPGIFAGVLVNTSAQVCSKCSNECSVDGQRVCDGNGWKQCGNYDSDSCLEWGNKNNCAWNETCSNGSCVPTCTDECNIESQRVCFGNGWKQCNKGSDGCFHWSTINNCDWSQKCSNGSCVNIDICSDTLSGSPTNEEKQLCANAGGTIYCGNGWCKCNCAQEPTVDLTYSGSVTCNQQATLAWTSTHATSCTASGAWSGSKPTSGSESVGNFTGSRTFTLTCSGSGGTASDSVTLTGTSEELNVSAGSDKEVDDGESVRLDGSVDGDYDSVHWTCTGGELSNRNILRPTWSVDSDYNCNYSDNYYWDHTRSYTCTLTATNECGSDSDSMRITVNRDCKPSEFNVALTARPKADCAPLNDVDLIAEISNYYDGNYRYDRQFTYYFDCENDGIWDKTVTTADTIYTAVNLCDYYNPGSYTARVRVEAYGRSATDTDIVRADQCPVPQPQIARFSITKMVRDVSMAGAYQASITANPADTVSYRIVVAGIQGKSDHILVRDAVPNGIFNVRDLAIDGIPVNGDIISGIDIGSLCAGQTKTITYTAAVAAESYLGYGQNALANTATVIVDGGSANSTAIVYVWRRAVQGATIVSTGFDSNFAAGLIASFIGIILCLAWIFGVKLAKTSAKDPMAALRQRIAMIRANGLSR